MDKAETGATSIPVGEARGALGAQAPNIPEGGAYPRLVGASWAEGGERGPGAVVPKSERASHLPQGLIQPVSTCFASRPPARLLPHRSG